MKHATPLFLTLFSAYFSLSMVNPLLGPIFRALHLSEIEASLVFSIAALSLFVSSIFWGNRVQKWGKKKILIAGTFHFSLSYLFFGLSIQLGLSHLLSFTLLFLCLLLIRLYGGVVFAAMLTSSQALMADITSKQDRSSGMALIGAANGLGLIIGPAVGGLLVGVHFTVPIYLAALFPVVMTLVLLKALPNESGSVRSEEKWTLTPFDKGIFPYLLISFCINLIFVILHVTLGYYLQDRLNMNAAEAAQWASFALVAPGITMFVSQIVIVRKFKLTHAFMLYLGFPLFLVGFLGFLFSPSYPWIIASFSIIGLGAGLIIPGYLTAASLAVGDRLQGAVAGLTSASNGIGAMLAPIIGSALYNVFPEFPYYLALFLISGLTIMVYFLRPNVHSSSTTLSNQ
ncbi:MFS transporter [Laceyella putida]|uniref:MFS transporter n=1 Tax=Laceyella putida TaxID=110101 RepID=A0ABW2RFG3_9BACL